MTSALNKVILVSVLTPLIYACGGGGSDTPAPAPITYTTAEKIANRSTVEVFQPWAESDLGNCKDGELWFVCDTPETPYGLVWHDAGVSSDMATTTISLSVNQKDAIVTDSDTLHLGYTAWNYWYDSYQSLSPSEPYWTDREFKPHVGSEYGKTWVIDFTKPEWHQVLAEKAVNMKSAGYNGIMFDWWNDRADGDDWKTEAEVQQARISIATDIRSKAGDDFIILANTGWDIDVEDKLLSGVFLEFWKDHGGVGDYPIYSTNDNPRSIQGIEEIILFHNNNLSEPRIIAVEPFKVTENDPISDRYSDKNLRLAKMFTAMTLVLADNGYILYADNGNDFQTGSDHTHAYYDVYHTDLGKATGKRVETESGVGYKKFENGYAVYNRNDSDKTITVDGSQYTITALSGRFIEL